jgi:hypothetical protein
VVIDENSGKSQLKRVSITPRHDQSILIDIFPLSGNQIGSKVSFSMIFAQNFTSQINGNGDSTWKFRKKFKENG